jgi:hypothetical protein
MTLVGKHLRLIQSSLCLRKRHNKVANFVLCCAPDICKAKSFVPGTKLLVKVFRSKGTKSVRLSIDSQFMG